MSTTIRAAITASIEKEVGAVVRRPRTSISAAPPATAVSLPSSTSSGVALSAGARLMRRPIAGGPLLGAADRALGPG